MGSPRGGVVTKEHHPQGSSGALGLAEVRVLDGGGLGNHLGLQQGRKSCQQRGWKARDARGREEALNACEAAVAAQAGAEGL
jgi:hypothetical protein